MKMTDAISFILVEDDPAAATMAQDILHSHFPEVTMVNQVQSVASARTLLATDAPDFVILDINLKDGDAFTLLKQLECIPFKIIFVTAYDRYAVEAFRFSALDYVLKPYAPAELVAAVAKVVQELARQDYHQQLQALLHNFDPRASVKKLVLKNLEAVHVVDVAEVLYIQADSNYSCFFLTNRQKIIVAKTLKAFEKELKGQYFFRIHQSYLVNINHVQSFDKLNDTLLLSEATILPVAQSKKKILVHFLDQLR